MSIDELYDWAYKDENSFQTNQFISYLKPHEDFLINIPVKTDKNLHEKVMRLVSDYGHYLIANGEYQKAPVFINRGIYLFETYPDFTDTNLFKIEYYEMLRFYRAIANFHLKNYKEAKQELSALSHHFPTNEIYKDWLSANKSKQIKSLNYCGIYLLLQFPSQ